MSHPGAAGTVVFYQGGNVALMADAGKINDGTLPLVGKGLPRIGNAGEAARGVVCGGGKGDAAEGKVVGRNVHGVPGWMDDAIVADTKKAGQLTGFSGLGCRGMRGASWRAGRIPI